MHYIHKILVKTNSKDKDEIRGQAVEETEQFWNTVYDWRETDTAGKWSDKYPDNVIIGSEDIEALIKAVEESRQVRMLKKNGIIEILKALILRI